MTECKLNVKQNTASCHVCKLTGQHVNKTHNVSLNELLQGKQQSQLAQKSFRNSFASASAPAAVVSSSACSSFTLYVEP